MKVLQFWLVAVLLTAAAAWGQEGDAQRGRKEAEDGMEVLTRGPVHEAFAGTITFDPEPGVVVDQPPPEAIEELPPDQKPHGANVDWIPGYWAWDDERSDFLWVSGIWRSLPPGRQWVSGYWGTSGRSSQWTSGYWADSEASEIEYLPEPPETVEAGPNIDAPSANHTWLPGCWVWHQNRYAWRPGNWVTAQLNWVWTPAHYVWSPRGYVFVDGYYDYSVARRGVLFAPVYFNSSIYSRRGFAYSPITVINPAVFHSHLFLRPSYGHYYFGDYYASNYSTVGFSPWFSFYTSRSGYDPFYAHQRWQHRKNREWDRRVEADFAHRRDNEDARPPRTWTDQRDRRPRDSANNEDGFVMAAPLEELVKSKDAPIRFEPVAKEERQQIVRRGQEIRDAREQRKTLESDASDPLADAANSAADVRPNSKVRPVKVKLPKTPIAALPAERLGEDQAPPKAVDVPQPDSKVEPKPRKARGNPKADPKTTDNDPSDSPQAASQEDPKVEPMEPKVEPMEPKVEPKKEPKVEPKKEPKVEPKKEPKVEPKKEPKVEPKKEPKVEPKKEPKVEPKKEPKVEPKKEPKVEPKKDPKKEPKSRT